MNPQDEAYLRATHKAVLRLTARLEQLEAECARHRRRNHALVCVLAWLLLCMAVVLFLTALWRM